jgi:transcriptional regulator with XRE-family HTH domain
MVTREQLLQSVEYWLVHAQGEIYRQVIEYIETEKITQTELANRLGVSKGYVSQILKGEFNYTLKKLIELSLAVGKVPVIKYKAIRDVIREDQSTRRVRRDPKIENPLSISHRRPSTKKKKLAKRA